MVFVVVDCGCCGDDVLCTVGSGDVAIGEDFPTVELSSMDDSTIDNSARENDNILIKISKVPMYFTSWLFICIKQLFYDCIVKSCQQIHNSSKLNHLKPFCEQKAESVI